MNMIELLGVNISTLKKEGVKTKLNEFLDGERVHYVVTPNPEFLVLAHKDNEYCDILNSADLAVADGVGLQYAAFLTRQKIPPRVTGNDIVEMLCKIGNARGASVFLLGGVDGIAQATSDILRKKFPSLIINSSFGGEIWHEREGEGKGWHMNPAVIKEIKNVHPQILFIALKFGNQERWLRDFLPHLPSVRIGVGVGGTFNYLSGMSKRAPKWMRTLGLEFLYRLFSERWRARRIYNAVFVFLWLVLKSILLSTR